MTNCNICAVIPAYNAAKTVKQVVNDLKECSKDIQIIVVNDGSTDTTESIVKDLDILYLEHKKNLGKGTALRSGFRRALSLAPRYILTLDADAQHNPKNLAKFVNKLEDDDLDFVIGSRMSDISGMPLHRILSNRITSKLISWRIGQNIVDSQSGFRLIRANVLRNMTLNSKRFELESELLIKAGLNGYKIGFANIETIYHKNQFSSMKIIDIFRFVILYLKSFFW
ncbi:MAG: glycosyltransferase family 2 protein [bacterium]